MTTLDLEVPEEEQTLGVAKEYYRFQIEYDGYDSSTDIEDRRDFRRFRENLEKKEEFWLYETVNHRITNVCGRELQSVWKEYRNEDWTVYDQEGLSRFIEVLKEIRQKFDAEGELDNSTEQIIQQCLNLVQFAKEHGYGVAFSP